MRGSDVGVMYAKVRTSFLYLKIMLKSCFQNQWIEAGCDEAGRGPLAGPVAAAAVILPQGWEHPLLNDSKQMSEKNRYLLREIIQQQAVAWAVAMVDPEEIDRINILNASFLAMSRAVEQLAVRPQLLLIDGNRFRSKLEIPYRCFVGGDATFAPIAAASVLAKTYRDDFMVKIAQENPVYNWQKNKGYPTTEHREAIRKYGVSPYHRMSFCGLKDQLDLFNS